MPRIAKRHRTNRRRSSTRRRHSRRITHTRRMRGGAFVNDEHSFFVRLIGIIHDEAGDINVGQMYEFDQDVINKILEWYTVTTQRLINNGTIQHIRNAQFEYNDEEGIFKVRFEYDDTHQNEREHNIDIMLNHWEIIEDMPPQNNPIPEIVIDGVHWYPEKDHALQQINQNQNQNQNQLPHV